MADQPRRPRTLNDARTEAEAAFKRTTTKVAEAPPKKTALPGVKELVSLRIDQDVLEHFQKAEPGGRDASNVRFRKQEGNKARKSSCLQSYAQFGFGFLTDV